MTALRDYTRDLRALAELASQPNQLETVLHHALATLRDVVPYDLAAVLTLEGDELTVEVADGPLANERVRRHRLRLSAFPTIVRALETRKPIALEEHNHAGKEGDPYDGVLDLEHGHSCMVVPLYAADRSLGIITLDRRVCETYEPEAVELAGIYGQLVSHAMLFAQQSRLLGRELLKELERAAISKPAGVIDATHLGLGDSAAIGSPSTEDENLATMLPLHEHERRYLAQALRRTNGKIYGADGAAQLLGLKPTTLQSKLKKHRLKS